MDWIANLPESRSFFFVGLVLIFIALLSGGSFEMGGVKTPELPYKERLVIAGVGLLLLLTSFLMQGSIRTTSLFNPPKPKPSPTHSVPSSPSTTESGQCLDDRRISDGECFFYTSSQPEALQDKRKGVMAIEDGDYKEAIKNLRKALEEDPNDPESRIFLSNALIKDRENYAIAVSVQISGDKDVSQEILRGVAQAQYEINTDEGGIGDKGIPVKVTVANDGENGEYAEETALKLIDNKNILGVIGHATSDITLKIREVYREKKLVSISPVSTSVELSDGEEEPSKRFFFRTVPSDAIAAKALGEYLFKKLQKNKVAVFFNSSSKYSNSLKLEFVNYVKENNGKVIAEFDIAFDNNQKIKKLVERSINEKAEVLALLLDFSKRDQALEVIETNKKRKSLLGGDDMYSIEILGKENGENALNMIVAVPWAVDNHKETDFVKNAKKLWGTEKINWRTALAYDAARVFIEALEKLEETELDPDRLDVQKTISFEGFSIEEGASDRIEFEKDSGDRCSSSIELVKVVKQETNYAFKFEKKIPFQECE